MTISHSSKAILAYFNTGLMVIKKNIFKSKFAWTLYLISILFFLRGEILFQIANFLVIEEDPIPTEKVIVLSGRTKERCNKAMDLFQKGYYKQIVVTGENLHWISGIIDSQIYEPDIAEAFLLKSGIDSKAIYKLNKGTSTKEESEHVLEYCKKEKLQEISIVTSAFHSRRVKYMFEKTFKNSGITIHYQVAHHPVYDCTNWWHFEGGLIACNNEWIKLLFYIYKH